MDFNDKDSTNETKAPSGGGSEGGGDRGSRFSWFGEFYFERSLQEIMQATRKDKTFMEWLAEVRKISAIL